MMGVILCGGRSMRMGSDKGLLKQEEKTWAETAATKLSSLDIPVKISVNNDQYEIYSRIFPVDDLVKDNSSIPVKGPLLGVLSAHVLSPAEDLFVLACDLLHMQSTILRDLYVWYQQQPEADALIYTNDGEPEPLCGIYTAAGLSKIIDQVEAGDLPKQSMKYALSRIRPLSRALSSNQKHYFRNFNAHAPLNGM